MADRPPDAETGGPALPRQAIGLSHLRAQRPGGTPSRRYCTRPRLALRAGYDKSGGMNAPLRPPAPAAVAAALDPAAVALRISLVILAEAALLAAILFRGAGTVDWEWAWALFLVAGASGLPAVLGLARHDPALLASRTRMAPRDQPLEDRIFVPLHTLLVLAWAWVTGHDAARLHWLPVPEGVKALALLAVPAITWAGYRTLRDNPYLAPCVCVQEDRAHRVIDTGAYAVVRHPFYAVAIAYQAAAALVLGSVLGLMGTALIGLTFAARIGIEERFLLRNLPGYAAYTRVTRWRLLPGLW